MHYKILHSFAENPSHNVPQALAIASELAISLRRWSNIDNWHVECVEMPYKVQSLQNYSLLFSITVVAMQLNQGTNIASAVAEFVKGDTFEVRF